MRRVALPAVLLLATVGCSGSSSDTIPPGTWSGSSADDREFTIEVGEDVEVNRAEARYVDRGVLEVRPSAKSEGIRTRLTCEVSTDEEELRCDVTTERPGRPPTTEVIDLMLL